MLTSGWSGQPLAADAAGHTVDPQYYLDVAKALDSPAKLKVLAADEAGAAAVKVAGETLSAFHWDLTFPKSSARRTAASMP